MIVEMIRLARPRHWVKNVIVLFPIVFARQMDRADAWAGVLLAAAAFCLASSAGYIVNDIRDRFADRLHPAKKGRPLASGAIGVGAAWIEAAVLATGALALSAVLGPIFVGLIVAYLLLQAAYTGLLKRKMLVDVIAIALGFVLRAAGGAVALRVEISPWLFVCTFTLCLFMGFCKRCNEVATLADAGGAGRHRPTLAGYTPELLTHLITLSGAIAVISFLLYASSGMTVERFGTIYLIYTTPVVIYGVFRFAMLSMQGRYADPTDLILRDRPFQATVALWMAAVVVVVLKGRAIQDWLRSLY